MRNPVTDLTTMIGVSDIEDWVAFEAGVTSTSSRYMHHVSSPSPSPIPDWEQE
jgi:hypothetical protein